MESYSKKVVMTFMFQKPQFTNSSYYTHYFGHGVLIHKTRAYHYKINGFHFCFKLCELLF